MMRRLLHVLRYNGPECAWCTARTTLIDGLCGPCFKKSQA